MRLQDALSIGDLERLAQKRLPRVLFECIGSGVEDEQGVIRNETAFHKHQLLARHLVDVSKRDQSTTIFGRTYASPFGISPTGIAEIFRRGADSMLAQAAAAAKGAEHHLGFVHDAAGDDRAGVGRKCLVSALCRARSEYL